MNQLDNDLREALRRREPPAGFAAQVLARTRELETPARAPFGWRWAIAAAAMLVLVAGSLLYREQVRRVEGEKAKEQVMLALRLTGSKLAEIRTHLER